VLVVDLGRQTDLHRLCPGVAGSDQNGHEIVRVHGSSRHPRPGASIAPPFEREGGTILFSIKDKRCARRK